MTFKDEILEDINKVYLNVDEFGAEHLVEGENVICVFDDEALKERQAGQEIGVAESSVLLFAKTETLPFRKAQKGAGSHLNIDNKEYIVDDWSEDMGVSQITLHQSRSI